MALASLTQFKSQLSITSTDEDTLLQQILDSVESAIKSTLDRDIERDNYTEYYSGNGMQDFVLRNTPVDTSETVAVYLDQTGNFGQDDDSFASTTLLTYGTDYAIVVDNSTISTSGIVRRLGFGLPFDIGSGRPYGSLTMRYRQAIWPYGAGNIKVTYTGGYATVPADITLATLQMASSIYQSRKYGGAFLPGSERLGEYSYSLVAAKLNGSAANVPGTPANLLKPYRRLNV